MLEQFQIGGAAIFFVSTTGNPVVGREHLADA